MDRRDWIQSALSLILTDDPHEAAQLETAAGLTRAETVDTIIIFGSWEEHLPLFIINGGGGDEERLDALRVLLTCTAGRVRAVEALGDYSYFDEELARGMAEAEALLPEALPLAARPAAETKG